MKHHLLMFLSMFAFFSLAQAQDEIYVANPGSSSVTIYSTNAAGNEAPVRTISGPATGLDYPYGITVDSLNNELYVADFFGQAVRVFPLSANGNAAPIRTLVNGPNSDIRQVRSVVVDTVNDEILVANIQDSIRVFTRTANGDAVPLRVISGTNTLLDNPYGLKLDLVNNEIFVTSYDVGGFGVPGILAFARTADSNVSPLRSIFGSNTKMGTFSNFLTLDLVNSEIFAQGNNGDGVVVFPRTATGNVPPKRNLYNGSTDFSGSICIDHSNDQLIVTSRDNNSLSFFPRTATGNTAPLKVISGSATGLSDPVGLDISYSSPFPWALFLPAVIIEDSSSKHSR